MSVLKTKVLSLFCCLSLMAVEAVSAAQTPNVTPNTMIRFVTAERLKSGTAKRGDVVRYIVDQDVMDKEGRILISKGTTAYGTILNSRSAGAWGRRGALDFSVEYTTAVDGQRVNLSGVKDARGNGDKGLVTAGALLVAWPIAFARGSNITIEPGTAFSAYVNDTLYVNPNATAADNLKVPNSKIVLTNGEAIIGKVLDIYGNTYEILSHGGKCRIEASNIKSINIINSK